MSAIPSDLHFHALKDGRKLAWRQSGKGRPLVMLHGWSMSGAVFAEVAKELSSHFQVFCPDLSGHGWSEAGAISLEALVRDLCEWLSALRIERPALLGWSLGGQVAIPLALAENLSVERLILMSTTPCFCQKGDWAHGLPVTQVRTMKRQLQRAYLKTLGDFFDLQFSSGELSAERRREVLAFAVRPSRIADPENCIDALEILSSEDLRDSLPSLTCQTLVLHGSNDQIIPCGAGEYLAETIQGARFHCLQGIGHAPFISRPGECVEQIRRFLQ